MNDVRLKKCFAESLGLNVELITEDLAYNSVKQWDSVGHMSLVAALEGEFNVMLDTDEIIAMSSVAVARDVLRKHGVSFA
jgi:acyl carrier protein